MDAGVIQEALRERLLQLESVKNAFQELFPEGPKRIPRGDAQDLILSLLGWARCGHNRRLISEALVELGYDKVKTEGNRFYRKRALTP